MSPLQIQVRLRRQMVDLVVDLVVVVLVEICEVTEQEVVLVAIRVLENWVDPMVDYLLVAWVLQEWVRLVLREQ